MFGGSLGAISTAADWNDAQAILDSETGEPIDLTGASVTMTVKDSRGCQILCGSTEGGEIAFPDIGVFNWVFPSDRLSRLCAGTYGVGILIEQEGQREQLFLGNITIQRGF